MKYIPVCYVYCSYYNVLTITIIIITIIITNITYRYVLLLFLFNTVVVQLHTGMYYCCCECCKYEIHTGMLCLLFIL
jgi:hypothetical protein